MVQFALLSVSCSPGKAVSSLASSYYLSFFIAHSANGSARLVRSMLCSIKYRCIAFTLIGINALHVEHVLKHVKWMSKFIKHQTIQNVSAVEIVFEPALMVQFLKPFHFQKE